MSSIGRGFYVETCYVSGRFSVAVRIENELHRRALIEIGIAFGCLLKRDHLRIDDVRDWDAIVEDRLHELAIVAQDRRLLAGKEGMRLRPAEPEIEGKRAFRCLFVVRS